MVLFVVIKCGHVMSRAGFEFKKVKFTFLKFSVIFIERFRLNFNIFQTFVRTVLLQEGTLLYRRSLHSIPDMFMDRAGGCSTQRSRKILKVT